MSAKTEILKRVKEGKGLRAAVPCPDPLGEMEIRSLTQIEVDQVNDLLLKGQEIVTRVTQPGKDQEGEEPELDLSLDIGKILSGQAQGDRLIVAFALSVDEKWKPEEAGALPPAAFRLLLAEAKELTGPDALVDAEAETQKLAGAATKPKGEREAPTLDEVRSFRDEPRGADDARAPSRRRAARAQSG